MALTIDELKELIQTDDHRQLELKKTTGELKDGMHSACAFLNTEGGWLIFGIAPKSLKILGQQVTDNTQQEIAQALSYMEPHLQKIPACTRSSLCAWLVSKELIRMSLSTTNEWREIFSYYSMRL